MYRTEEQALVAACERSREPAYCPLHPAVRGVWLTDTDGAHGKLYITKHPRRCKDGKVRDFFMYRIGA